METCRSKKKEESIIYNYYEVTTQASKAIAH
jgi:hypothetical protein